MSAVAETMATKFDAAAAEAKAEENKVPPTSAEGQPETNKMMDTVAAKLKEEVEAGRLEVKEDSPVKQAPTAETAADEAKPEEDAKPTAEDRPTEQSNAAQNVDVEAAPADVEKADEAPEEKKEE